MPHRTARRIGRRLAEIGLTLLGVAVLVFVTLRVVPGDQITSSLGVEAGDLSPAQLAALKAYYGVDEPQHEARSQCSHGTTESNPRHDGCSEVDR